MFRNGGGRLGAAVEVFGAEDEGADEALDVFVVRLLRLPQPLVEAALVLIVAHLAAEVEDEVSLDDGANEPLLVDRLLRERGQTLTLERIARHHLMVRVVDGSALLVLLLVLAVVRI